MIRCHYSLAIGILAVALCVSLTLIAPSAVSADAQTGQQRKPEGDGSVKVTGELKQWHKVTLTIDGSYADERDNDPNPFTDYRLKVSFKHESGEPQYDVPGYFAADGDAANTSASAGTKWRAHLSPDKPGKWTYAVSFIRGKNARLEDEPVGEHVKVGHAATGSFTVAATDKTDRDFRGRGRLQYVGGHHLRFAGTAEYYLKMGPDAPESLLAYADFDGTEPGRRREARSGEAPPTQQLHHYQPHVADWKVGDPTWKGDKGKGLIGAFNYLASKGCNNVSFLPYNVRGDGDNVWPFVARNDKLHYDCSKLDQWQIVFDHATNVGLHLHFKLQENEIDDNRRGSQGTEAVIPESLDGGKLGPERKLYCQEMIARFSHELAVLWNLGEENTQSPEEQRDMIRYLHLTDPYKHNIVVHTFPSQQDKVYPPLLGKESLLTGASLQNSWHTAHQKTLKWVRESAAAGQPWVVCNDEQNPASLGVPPDPGYKGHDGIARVRVDANAKQGDKGPSLDETRGYTLHDIRKLCLWGTLMAGGGGVEYFFGYALPEDDLQLEDFRSRDQSWEYGSIAIEFFRQQKIPFWEMTSSDALVGNPDNTNSRYCFAKPGEVYLVYLPTGGSSDLDLSKAAGSFRVQWFNPRAGGALISGPVTDLEGGRKVSLGIPPQDPGEDWLVMVRKKG